MFDLDAFHRWMGLLRQTFIEQQANLNALDAAVGDGDHGDTLRRAFEIAEQITQPETTDLGRAFDLAAQALAESGGGAIGPILSALFSGGGLALTGLSQAGTKELALFLRFGLDTVMRMGGAKAGDKTLVDALIPAAQVLSERQDQPLEQALGAAVLAAQAGAQATQEMRATHGRASFLGDRSRGHLDAGAVSLSLILSALLRAVQGDQPAPAPERKSSDFTPAAGKFINHPDNMVNQDNLGLALAFPHYVRCTEDGILVRAQPKPRGKVGLAIGHGGGHTPSMGGLIGPGLLDADVYGPLFTCASGVRIARAAQAADRGGGVVLLVSNHAGDVLNARLAQVRAEALGLRVASVLSSDDIATAPRAEHLKRRGLGGLLFMLKTGGAAAENGQSLEETVRMMEKTNLRTATLSVAARPGTHPVTGQPLFNLPAGLLEIGTGVHGELGVYRGPHLPADAVIDLLLDRLLADLECFLPAPLIVFLNGSGGVSKMELHILYRRVCQSLGERGLRLAAGVVDSLFTTQETGGFSLSLLAADEDIWQAWQQPAAGAYFRWPL